MNSNIKPGKTRVLGRYAVRWTHVTDWYKAYAKRLRKSRRSKRPDSSPADISQTQESPSEKPEVQSGTTTVPESEGSNDDKSESQSTDQKSQEEEKLKEITTESEGVLIRVKTVFPFTLFRDIITIDRHKLTIVYRMFFRVEHTVSVPIENIKNIQANLGPFFGSLIITSDHFINNTQNLNYLSRRDAEKIQKMVQGAMVAVKEQIDISKVETKKLKKLLSELGKGRTGTVNA